jgi:predicted DCC family thiol-disulfide oxidoreductase YuxK
MRFFIKRDPKKKLLFATLQGEVGRKLAAEYGIDAAALNTVILIENNKTYTKSTASLRICRYLRRGWPLMYGFIIVPRIIRDFVYNIFSRNRYRWYGKRQECMVPPEDWRERFL